MAIKWKKADVIKKFQEAMTSSGSENGQRPNVLQGLMDKAKQMAGKLGGGGQPV